MISPQNSIAKFKEICNNDMYEDIEQKYRFYLSVTNKCCLQAAAFISVENKGIFHRYFSSELPSLTVFICIQVALGYSEKASISSSQGIKYTNFGVWMHVHVQYDFSSILNYFGSMPQKSLLYSTETLLSKVGL